MSVPQRQTVTRKETGTQPAPSVKGTNTQSPAANRRAVKSPRQELIKMSKAEFPLTRKNFLFMGISFLLIVVGFLLMLGSGTTTESFNEDIFSTRRIIIGPTMAFIGFVCMGISIVYNKKQKKSDTTEVSTDK